MEEALISRGSLLSLVVSEHHEHVEHLLVYSYSTVHLLRVQRVQLWYRTHGAKFESV